jgi:hypothetical protein
MTFPGWRVPGVLEKAVIPCPYGHGTAVKVHDHAATCERCDDGRFMIAPCPHCGRPAASRARGWWECHSDGVFAARVCPGCWHLGTRQDARGLWICTAPAAHPFRASRRACGQCHHGYLARRKDVPWMCPACLSH